jgi:hypothetical protein
MAKSVLRGSLAVLLLLGLIAAPALAARNSLDAEGPEAQAPEGVDGLDAWTFDLEVVNGCYALVTGTVTDSGGGTSQAALTTYDDGVLIDFSEFSFPANGVAQPYCWVYQQVGEPGGGAIAIALRDTVASEDAYDFSNFDISGTCTGPAPSCAQSLIEIPTLDAAGVGLLTLALAAAAVFGLRRRRRA